VDPLNRSCISTLIDLSAICFLSFVIVLNSDEWNVAGVPSELAEDPKFVPLNADDPVYGPPVSVQHFSCY